MKLIACLDSRVGRSFLVFAAATLVAACGGGGGGSSSSGGGGSPPVTPPSTSPQASADSYVVDWNAAKMLAVTDNDSNAASGVLTVMTAPANGTVSVVGSSLQYTPKTGYVGKDTLRYKLSVGSASSEADVALTVQAKLTVQGRVAGFPSANTKVVAQLGSAQAEVKAEQDGSYSMEFTGSDPDALLTLSAQLIDKPSLRISMPVSDLRTLAAQAVAGKVGPAQVPGLTLSYLNAAVAALAAQRTGLAKPNLAQLIAAADTLGTDLILDAAVLTKLVVDGTANLPAGLASTDDLLASEKAMADLSKSLLALSSNPVTAMRQTLASDKSQTQAPKTSELSGGELVYVNDYGTSSTGLMSLFLAADGTANLVRGNPASTFKGQASDAQEQASWVMDGAHLRLALKYPEQFSSSTTHGFVVTDFVAGLGAAQRSFVGVEVQSNGSTERRYNWRAVKRYLPGRTLDLAAADFAGKSWAGLFANLPADVLTGGFYRYDAFFTFASDGTVAALFQNRDTGWIQSSSGLRWRVADGLLELSQSNGLYSYAYRRLSPPDRDGIELWRCEVRKAGRLIRAGVTPVAKADQLINKSEDFVGNWHDPFSNSLDAANDHRMSIGANGAAVIEGVGFKEQWTWLWPSSYATLEFRHASAYGWSEYMLPLAKKEGRLLMLSSYFNGLTVWQPLK